MIEFTLDVGDILVINDDIKVINMKREPQYLKFQMARIGIEAPKEIIVKQASDICL